MRQLILTAFGHGAAVREILELVPTEEILRGFAVGVSNQRGVVSKSMTEGGEQERELVKKYAELANIVVAGSTIVRGVRLRLWRVENRRRIHGADVVRTRRPASTEFAI